MHICIPGKAQITASSAVAEPVEGSGCRGKFYRKLEKDTQSDLWVFMGFIYQKVKCFTKNGSLKSLLE